MPDNSGVYLTALILGALGWAIVLLLQFRLMARTESRRNRFLLPVLTVFLIALYGPLFAFLFDGDIVAFILYTPLPTLAIFTLLPFIEGVIDWRGKGKDIAVLALCYSGMVFWYVAGSNLGTIDMIFLMMYSPLPVENFLFRMFSVIFYNYGLLVAIAGSIVAAPSFLAYFFGFRRGNFSTE